MHMACAWHAQVVVKGIMTAEDARIAADHCDAIVVSNHGGRQLDGCDATADVLRECRLWHTRCPRPELLRASCVARLTHGPLLKAP